MELKNYFAQDDKGNSLPSATCYLYLAGTTTLAAGLKNKEGSDLSNPFTADNTGLIQLAAPNGRYDLRVVKQARDYRIRVQFTDIAESMAVVAEAIAAAQTAAGDAQDAAEEITGATSVAPAPNKVPRADADGRLDLGWLSGVLASQEELDRINAFSQAENYDSGTLSKHAQAVVSVTDSPFNAVSGVDATAAFQAVYDFVPAGSQIVVPGPGPYTVGALTGTKEVTWVVQFNTATNLALLNLPGTVKSMHNDSQMTWRGKSKPADFANHRSDRTANHTGGTVGAVSANTWAKTSVAEGVLGFEWVNLNWLVNNGQGENCAGYDKADRYAGAKVGRGTFGRVVEARDYTGEADPTTALVAMEIDVFANGTDVNNLRIGTDYVAGKGLSDGATSQAGYAIRIGASNNDPTQGYFKTAILMQHRKQVGLRVIGATDAYSFESADTAVAAMKLGGTYSDSAQIIDGTAVVGTRYSGTFTNNNAIRFNAGMAIAWEATAQIRQLFGSGRMQFVNAGVEKTGFDTSTGAMFVVGTQVVGPRKTGWSTPTGSLSRAAYDTSSVTLPTLAGVVAAMITDLKAHGLMGA